MLGNEGKGRNNTSGQKKFDCPGYEISRNAQLAAAGKQELVVDYFYGIDGESMTLDSIPDIFSIREHAPEVGREVNCRSRMNIVDRTTKRRAGLLWHVRCCLSWISNGDLFGIEEIVLEDRLGAATNISPDWHHAIEGRNLAVGGQYFRRYGNEPASIVLYMDSAYRGIPKVYWLSPVMTLQLARTLAHEVGHHLIEERGYVFERGEKVEWREYQEELANRYSFSVRKRMLTRWHYSVANWLTRDLAGWHYAIGIADWNEGRYEQAATRWETAFCLDPNRQDADYWYHEAKKALAKHRAEDRNPALSH